MLRATGTIALVTFAAVASGCDTSPMLATSPAAPSALSGGSPAEARPGHAAAARPGESTIVEIAVGDDRFNLLVAAVVRAGLVETLGGGGQFTVFAPVDEAFVSLLGAADEAAAAATIGSLDPDLLEGILLYHVTNGRRTSNSVLKAPRYQMLNGDTLTRATLTAAGIVQADISASNGVIHAISTVLQP